MKQSYPDGANYNYYSIPGDPLSQLNKAVAVTCNEEDIDLVANTKTTQIEQENKSQVKEEVNAEKDENKLKEEKETLKQMVKKGNTSKT